MNSVYLTTKLHGESPRIEQLRIWPPQATIKEFLFDKYKYPHCPAPAFGRPCGRTGCVVRTVGLEGWDGRTGCRIHFFLWTQASTCNSVFSYLHVQIRMYFLLCLFRKPWNIDVSLCFGPESMKIAVFSNYFWSRDLEITAFSFCVWPSSIKITMFSYSGAPEIAVFFRFWAQLHRNAGAFSCFSGPETLK